MKNKNSGWIWAFVVLVVILIIAIGMHMHKVNVANQAGNYANPSDVITPTEDVSAGSADLPATTGVAPVTISYQNALNEYSKSRFQFDDSCKATPNAATFAVGTKIMLDNRSAQARVFHLGSMGDFSVKGYGFKIVQLSLTNLSTNAIAVDCGAQQNVATITVQK